MTLIPKPFALWVKLRRFVKGGMLLFHVVIRVKSQAFKEARKYTPRVEQMDERKAEKKTVLFVQKCQKEDSLGH